MARSLDGMGSWKVFGSTSVVDIMVVFVYVDATATSTYYHQNQSVQATKGEREVRGDLEVWPSHENRRALLLTCPGGRPGAGVARESKCRSLLSKDEILLWCLVYLSCLLLQRRRESLHTNYDSAFIIYLKLKDI